jgi:BioD-like phosphotransacetylase family protein
MSAFLLVSPRFLSGKTTVAVGLARRFQQAGKSVALLRLAGDAHSSVDMAFFSGLPGASRDAASADEVIMEAPAGNASGAQSGIKGGRLLVVLSADTPPAEAAEFVRGLGPDVAGVVVNKAPVKRMEAIRSELERVGIRPLALIREDRLLASPTLKDVAQALDAETIFLDGAVGRVLDRPVIASIAADPGQGYFARHGATAVIVRSDKPDLQLAALNAGATCLIVTGGLPILSYVLDRAEEDEIPLLKTNLETVPAVGAIESLYGAAPFGGEAKIKRIAELLSDFDVSALESSG